MSGSRCADITRTSWRMPRSLELLGRRLHRGHVALGAHDDADARGVDLHARRTRPRPPSRWRARGSGCSLMLSAMSRRSWRPSNAIMSAAAYAASRAAARRRRRARSRSSTRPPAVTTSPPSLRGARVEHLDARRDGVEAGDHVAGATTTPGSRARRARRQTAARGSHSSSTPASPPGSVARSSSVEQVGAQAREHDLRLRDRRSGR